jgi:hypothetical protein
MSARAALVRRGCRTPSFMDIWPGDLWWFDDEGGLMGIRRYAAVAAVASFALLAGMATASAEPARDTSDRGAVGVGAPQKQARAAAVEPILSEFVPVAPQRVLDTRNGHGALPPGGVVTVDLSYLPATTTAVVLNVTAVSPSAVTYVTVYPQDEPRPNASNLNVGPLQTRANQVTVALGANGLVNLYNNDGFTHLVADLGGYYVADRASYYNLVTPGRVLDTRNGGPVGPGGVVTIHMPWLPASTTAVTFNLTAVNATTSTYVTAFPTGQELPLASNVNITPGQTVPNQVTVAVGGDRQVSLYNGGGSVHLIADLAGYYTPEFGDYFMPVTPERAMDTRIDPPSLTPDIFIGLYGLDSTDPDVQFTGVAANLTGTNVTETGYVRVWPGGAAEPNTSNLNLVPGQTAANAVNVGIDHEPQINNRRTVNFANSAGKVDVIFDVAGFFVAFV